jgi:IS1 family transposase
LDELWSFVQNKKNQCWIWIALCTITKQAVVVVAGDRSKKTCKALWREIPWRYRKAKCYSDFWEAYQPVIPSDQHEAVGSANSPQATTPVRCAYVVKKVLSCEQERSLD